MRRVYTDREEAREIGKRARQDVIQQFNQETVARMVVSRVAEIEQNVKRKRRRQENIGASVA